MIVLLPSVVPFDERLEDNILVTLMLINVESITELVPRFNRDAKLDATLLSADSNSLYTVTVF